MIPSALPAPRIIDPASVPPLRWGIIGPGGIASSFADAAHKHTNQRVIAVASLTPGKGEAFAQARGIPHVVSTYDQLVEHDEVDVVYVATPHEFHFSHAMLAIRAGKHVLIEKPCALNPADVLLIARAAREAGVVAMEAMWTRYLPQSDIVRQLLADGVFGDIRLVQTDFGQDLLGVPRLLSPASGGALLDLGIYNLAFTSLVLGQAEKVTTTGTLTQSGVDDTTSSLFEFSSGARAIANVSLSAYTPTAASISGSDALLTVGTPFFTPTSLTLWPAEFNPQPGATWSDHSGISAHDGLCYEATALASYVAQGVIDSPLRPLTEVAHDIGLIQQARHQIGAYLESEERPAS